MTLTLGPRQKSSFRSISSDFFITNQDLTCINKASLGRESNYRRVRTHSVVKRRPDV